MTIPIIEMVCKNLTIGFVWILNGCYMSTHTCVELLTSLTYVLDHTLITGYKIDDIFSFARDGFRGKFAMTTVRFSFIATVEKISGH